MNIRLISIEMLAIGIMLITWAIYDSDSMSSDVSRFFSGSHIDKTVLFFIGGSVIAVIGLFGFLPLT